MADSLSPLSQSSTVVDPVSLAAPLPRRDEFARMLSVLLAAAARPQQLSPPTVSSPGRPLSGGLNGFDSLGLLLYLSLAGQLSKLGT
ncbi:MAG: hypothetical protein AAB427_10515, partial [Chloroflexota bacterium]